MRSLLLMVGLMAGCHEVSSTGAYGMWGQLVDDRSAPLGNQRIVSEDHGVVTEADGTFNIRWKDPTTFIDIQRGGIKWRRRWLKESDNGRVTVQIPEVSEGTVNCRTELECIAEIRWDAGNGLTGHLDVPCKDNTAALKVQGMPKTVPVVTCPTILGDLPLDVRVNANEVSIESKARPLPFAVMREGASAGCTPHILHGEIVEGVGARGLSPDKPTFAWAVCEGRAGTPVGIEPQAGGRPTKGVTVQLPWSAAGPDLVIDPPLAEPRALQLVHRNEAGEVVWELSLEPADGAEGTYRLPPLPIGRYRLGFGATKLMATMNPPEPEVPGEVWLFRSDGAWGSDGGLVGAMRLEEAKTEGQILLDVESAGSTNQIVETPR